MDGFLLKKLISNLVHIVPVAFIVLILCWLFRRYSPKFFSVVAISVCVVLITLSSPVVSHRIASQLQDAYPPVQSLPDEIAIVLVLGAGHYWETGLPENSVLTAVALSRLVEAVRLFHSKPDVKLMVSGAAFGNDISHAQAMGKMAMTLGVPRSSLVYNDFAKDTADEVKAAADWLNQFAPDQSVAIVSSAMHLTRAAAIASTQGVRYALAPTEYQRSRSPWYFFSAQNLATVDATLHEYIGILWHWINHR